MWKLSAILLAAATLSAQSPRYGVGRPPTPEEIRELGSAIAPDGTGLPPEATGHQAVRIEHPLLANPLIFTAFHSPEEMTFEKAKAWADGLDINGWSWRLPTVEEAFFLPDRSKYPSLDPNFFPDFGGYEWIWTSTVDAEAPSGGAWLVSLYDGYSGRLHRSNHLFVRAVRASQQLGLGV